MGMGWDPEMVKVIPNLGLFLSLGYLPDTFRTVRAFRSLNDVVDPQQKSRSLDRRFINWKIL